MFDVAIVGSGPAGASCAAFCAAAGLRTLLLEREKFPREKVCGDCLNPSCTPVLERLGMAEQVRASAHGRLERVEFVAIGGHTVSVALPAGAEIALKRSVLDQLLMERAAAAGAGVRDGVTVTALARNGDAWEISAGAETIRARFLVAADGRNSSVARLLGLLPRIEKERVGLQTHIPLPRGFGARVVLQFLPEGYSGQAPVNDTELNLCLVGRPGAIPALRAWAEAQFSVPRDHGWRTITPLRRAPIAAAGGGAFFVGDAARVVEPFTGEGIYYALRSGELAAQAIAAFVESGDEDAAARSYMTAHRQLYEGRLWVNRLARAAVLSPRVTSVLLRGNLLPRSLLGALTAKIVR
ncbi:MAG: NAD(P)/FAD-dependent oxidoreductase [Verrucomicrobiota bacterium]|nr:NAD(P)/FAD-dependent oxidoreductase [Verrucomicrobiota bacterium]